MASVTPMALLAGSVASRQPPGGGLGSVRACAPARTRRRVRCYLRAWCQAPHVPLGWRGTGALRLHTQLRLTFYGIGTPRFQVCSSVDCFGFKWSLCLMLNLAWLSARASWRAARVNIADRRFSPRL